MRGFLSLQYDKDLSNLRAQQYSDEINDLKASLDSIRKQQDELIKGHEDFVGSRSMPGKWYNKSFLETPYDLLVMLLVMIMGALGGMVRILRDYGSPDYPNPSSEEYVLLPLIGTVVAIGGYVLAKTGLLLLSSTKGETSLSPYMIGLVGIISGLLAKDVIEKIAESGHKILQQSPAGTEQDKDRTEVDAQAAAPKQGSSGQGGSTK